MSYNASKHAFIDTETLGLDPIVHPVWEIAVIVDGAEYVWQQMVSDRDIALAEPVALDLNGFTDRYDGDTAWTRGESIGRFAELVEGRHLVGCNVAFDEKRLASALLQWWGKDPTWHHRMRDINSMMHGYLTACSVVIESPYSSTDLSMRLSVDPDDFKPNHTALADARWAKAVFEAMVGPPR